MSVLFGLPGKIGEVLKPQIFRNLADGNVAVYELLLGFQQPLGAKNVTRRLARHVLTHLVYPVHGKSQVLRVKLKAVRRAKILFYQGSEALDQEHASEVLTAGVRASNQALNPIKQDK
jgi:hypothetical protein